MIEQGLQRASARPPTAPGTVGSRCGVRSSLLAIVALAVAVPAAAQFSVYPAVMELEAETSPATQTVTVENQGDEAIEVRVYLSDYDRTADGGHTYVAFGEHANTCGGRLEAFPDQLAVEPGERGEIRLRLDAGPGTCWAIAFVEKRTLTASGITVAQRIGVKVLAEVAGGVREGQVASFAMDTTAERAALLTFENESVGWLDVEGEIEVRDMAGEIVEVVEVDGFQVLPGRVRDVRVPLDGLALEPGRYILVAILDFGGDYLAGAQTLLEIEP